MKQSIKGILETLGLLDSAKQLKASIKNKSIAVQAYNKVLNTIKNDTFIVKLKELDGADIEIGRNSHLFRRIFLNDGYEPTTIEALKGVNLDGDLIDVGANIGIYSVFFGSRVRNDKRVLCLEPHPEMVEILTRNLDRNKITDKVILLNKAVSDKKGSFELNFVRGKEEYSSLEEIKHHAVSDEEVEKTQVEVDTLDNLIEENALAPSAIKIDVEGLELKVLMGMERTIEKYRPFIIVEVSDALNEGVSTAIFNLLGKYNYHFVDIENAKPIGYPFVGNLLASPK